MKSILISIKPKYVAEILNHRKTIEIRKTAPRCDLPIDVFIYCTKGSPTLMTRMPEDDYVLNGKVVAKFKLRFVEKIYTCGTDDLDTELGSSLEELSFESCVPEKDLLSYVGNGAFCWVISCLEIFDKPKELDEFGLKRAPESFCYIEKAPQ